MTMDEAFAKWAKNHELYDLPWQIDQKVLRGAFEAGWMAHAEAGKQTLIPVADDAVTAEDMAEAIYKTYPRKVGKAAAIKAIAKALRLSDHSPAGLLNATRRYADAVAKWPAEDKKFIPHPATWFNRGSYDDDPKEWQRGAAAAPSQFSKTYQ